LRDPNLTITFLEPEETYELRHQILRPHQTIDDCKYPLDFESATFHVGAFVEGELVSVASFFKEIQPQITGDHHYRLRGMATLVSHRNQKAGSHLIHFAEDYLRKKGASHWWCNARTNVQGYYSRFGMYIEGEVFDIPPIGPHILMVKELSPGSNKR